MHVRENTGGFQLETEYGNEIAIRLILGCLRTVAARLGVKDNTNIC